MKKSIVLTALLGFMISMVGDAVISAMFDPVRDKRMDQLSRYACGTVGLYHAFRLWHNEIKTEEKALPVSFFGSAFVFGLSVLFAGIFRQIKG